MWFAPQECGANLLKGIKTMSIYQEWMELAQDQARSQKDNNLFWQQYFDDEKELYKVLLRDHDTTYFGAFDTLADGFEWDHRYFIGFLDGINSSLKTPIVLEDVDHDTEITLDIDFEPRHVIYIAAHQVGGLAADARQRGQRLYRVRDHAAVPLF